MLTARPGWPSWRASRQRRQKPSNTYEGCHSSRLQATGGRHRATTPTYLLIQTCSRPHLVCYCRLSASVAVLGSSRLNAQRPRPIDGPLTVVVFDKQCELARAEFDRERRRQRGLDSLSGRLIDAIADGQVGVRIGKRTAVGRAIGERLDIPRQVIEAFKGLGARGRPPNRETDLTTVPENASKDFASWTSGRCCAAAPRQLAQLQEQRRQGRPGHGVKVDDCAEDLPPTAGW